MRDASARTIDGTPGHAIGLEGLLAGYRFRLCGEPESFAAALAVRRRVYCENFGYDVLVPDQYDHRAWLLMAEHVETGEVIGTMRVLPRSQGPLECEEYLRLPSRLATPKAVEISRFAILSAHRKTKTFFPVVSLGLFKLVYEFSLQMGAEYEVVCSKPERSWTYQSMGFWQTGLSARYEKLNGAEHELLCHDFRRAGTILAGNPFRELFCEMQFDEVVVPSRVPPLGLVEEVAPAGDAFRIAIGA